MTFKNLSIALRCLAFSGVAAFVASANSQSLRPPPDFDMPSSTKPMMLPKTLAGLTSGPVTMSRIASYGVCPISYPYSLSYGRDQAFAKFKKEGFAHIILPPPGPGAPPIEYLERTKNGLYQRVNVNGRRRGGGNSSTAVLIESVAKGSPVPAKWPKQSIVSFAKLTLGKLIPGTTVKGKLPDRVVLIVGTWDQPTRWESIYALSNDFDAVWRDMDSATNNGDWKKRGRRTYGEIRNTKYSTVSWIDIQKGPPMRSEGLKANTFIVVHYIKS